MKMEITVFGVNGKTWVSESCEIIFLSCYYFCPL